MAVLCSSARVSGFSSALAAKPIASTDACSKRQAEKFLLGESELKPAGVHVTVLRPSNVYGWGPRGNLGAILEFSQRKRLRPLPKPENHFSLTSFIDTCRASLISGMQANGGGKVFTLADDDYYTPTLFQSAAYETSKRNRPRWPSALGLIFFVGTMFAELLDKLRILRKD